MFWVLKHTKPFHQKGEGLQNNQKIFNTFDSQVKRQNFWHGFASCLFNRSIPFG